MRELTVLCHYMYLHVSAFVLQLETRNWSLLAKPVSFLGNLRPQRNLEEPLCHLWKLLEDPLAWLRNVSVALSRMMMY